MDVRSSEGRARVFCGTTAESGCHIDNLIGGASGRNTRGLMEVTLE